MNRMAKLTSIVVLLWVVGIGAITVAFVTTRPNDEVARYSALRGCLDTGQDINWCLDNVDAPRTFEWGGWLAWSGALTALALVVLVIGFILTRPQHGHVS